jgi:hypothetical protein
MSKTKLFVIRAIITLGFLVLVGAQIVSYIQSS